MDEMEQKQGIIDVFIPVYNAEKYLDKCLNSIVKQTIFEKLDIVIIDDGSTDHSMDIISKYSSEYSNIRAFRQTNKGLAFARQAGILAFLQKNTKRGKYFYTADSDDFLSPQMLEILLKTAEENNSDFTYCDYHFYPHAITTKAKWYKTYQKKLDWQLIERNTQPWNKLIRWDLSDSIHLPDIWPVYGDSVYVDLLVHAKKIVSIKDKLYYYRVGHPSMSGEYIGRLEFFQHVSGLANKQMDFISDLNNDDLNLYFQYRYIYTLIQVCFIAAINGNKSVYQETKRKLHNMKYLENRYTRLVLNDNFGVLKSFVLAYIVPKNYNLTRLLYKLS